nr:MAG TPA: hypothetical protein [Caudoviricetes sp.]
MQWIRNGKKYDTDTAELIWKDYKSVRVPYDEASKSIVRKFYKKRSGECFVVVETKRSSFGDSWNEKDPEIITFTEKEAKEYAEENLPAECYERAFGKVEE